MSIAPDLAERLTIRFVDSPVRRFLQFELDELELDRCVLRMAFRPELDNGGGAIHGGVLAMLADTAIACALSTNFDGKMGFATSNLNMHYLSRARSTVRCIATVIKKGATVCVAHVEILDERERLISIATGEFILTTSRFPARE